MKIGFKKALTIFKYLAIVFTIVYWIGIVIDDWVFIEKYWAEKWAEYIGGWFVWYAIFFLAFSIYYWLIATIIILIYCKLILRVKIRELNAFNETFSKRNQNDKLLKKNRLRFDSIISDERFNFLESIFKRLADNDNSLTDIEILDAYFKFSDNIQTNTFATAELEWVTISVLCHFRPNLTEKLIRRGLLSIVYSLGDDIDWFTVRQFIDKKILADKAEPYGGLPPEIGQEWLKNLLPTQKEIVQKVLMNVIEENRKQE